MSMILQNFCLHVCLNHQELEIVVSWEPSLGLLQVQQVLLTAEPLTVFCDVTVGKVITVRYSLIEYYCRLGYMVKLYLHHVSLPPEVLANAGQLVGVKSAAVSWLRQMCSCPGPPQFCLHFVF